MTNVPSPVPARSLDALVIGGGVVGMSLAYGMARAGDRVRLLDEGDDAYRAARGNFGLVWVQSKGRTYPPYAHWSMDAAGRWPALARDLAERTGIDVELSQPGGLSMALDEDELAARVAMMEGLRAQLGGQYPFEVLDARAVRERVPEVGPEVCGAVYGPLDGHVSPLRVLHALVRGFEGLGGQLAPGAAVTGIEHRGGVFRVRAGAAVHEAPRLVLAAGLGNALLAPLVGLRAPVQPNRGQVLVTERMRPFLRYPTHYVRQTGEGVVQIGDSQEDVGLDDSTTLAQLARIAARAQRAFPLLQGVNIVRSWGALRVMTPDSYPIYQASVGCPGAYVVTCHSGITLAAQHAGPLVDWLRGGPEPAQIRGFKAERFDVQAH